MGKVASINPGHEKERARKRAAALANKASEAQQEYLAILLNDVGFGTRLQRNDYLSGEVERDIKYLDELTFDEAHRLIKELKARRGDKT